MKVIEMSKTSTTTYNVGDRVQVKPGKNHDGMTMVHKWYTDDEVKAA